MRFGSFVMNVRRRRIPTAAAAAAALLALALAGCGRAEAGGVLRAAEVEGAVEVQAAGEAGWRPLKPGAVVGPGSQVRAAAAALVRLAGGKDAVEVTGGRLRVASASRLVLLEGRALVQAADGSMTIGDEPASTVATIAKGIVRFDLGSRIAVYAGEAGVEAVRSYRVPLLRELALATGDPELRPLRLVADGQDRWDKRYLGDAIELERQIDVVGRSLEQIYGAQVRDPLFYEKRVKPASAVAFLRSGPLSLSALLSEVAPIDVLTAVVMGLRVAGSADKLAESFRNLLALFDAGASWGVIAAELGLPSAEVVAGLEQALTPGAPPQTVAPPRPRGRRTITPTSPPTRPPGPTSSPRPSTSPTPSPPPTSPSPSPTPTSPSPTPSPTCSPLDIVLGTCSGSIGA